MPASAVGPGDIGRMVTLRVAGPDGAADVVGTLLAATDEALTVRRRDGRIAELRRSDVTHARLVPPGPAQLVDVLDLHRVMADGWRALEVEPLGEWLLRASAAFTRRANSALPLGDPGVAVDEALAAVERWYADRGLPPRMQVPDSPVTSALAGRLADRGWFSDSAAEVMTAELAPVVRARTVDVDVHLDAAPDDAWIALYRSDTGPLPPSARSLLTKHPLVVFASVREDGDVVAIARAGVDGRWAGLYAVEVSPARRREGLGRAVSVAALRWSLQRGARRAYLQTETGNQPALTLYESLGFTVHHAYRHWRSSDDAIDDAKGVDNPK